MTALLRIEGLRVDYPDRANILAGIDLVVAAGERVGVVGPNGAGKSSLFLAIAGVVAPRAGLVAVAGQRVAPGRFNPATALVFQQAEDQLFCPTVAEDVAFGARSIGLTGPALDTAVAEALAAVGLGRLADRPVHHLSGGEKRLVCIAGALVMQPQLILYDEPSAGLDIRNRRQLIGLMQATPTTCLVASHDLEFILETCVRVVLLDDGRIVADGPVRRILGDAALMERHGQERPHSLTHVAGPGHDHVPGSPVTPMLSGAG